MVSTTAVSVVFPDLFGNPSIDFMSCQTRQLPALSDSLTFLERVWMLPKLCVQFTGNVSDSLNGEITGQRTRKPREDFIEYFNSHTSQLG